jgi:CRP-like cAMP-binding protein
MINLEQLRRIYKFGRNITLADAQALLKAATTKSYPPGELLLKEGSLKKEVFLIRTGLVRVFKVNHRGDEITTAVRWEDKIIASPNTILFDKPSDLNIQAIEPTSVFCIEYDVVQTILANNPKLEANRKYFFQNIVNELLKRVDSFVMLSPEERYLDFVASNPDIVNRVPDKYIANILGITPVSLSRIRKRIANKKKS